MELVTQSSSPNAPPRRAWFRYRLRTFLILVSLIAVWLGWTVHRARTQRAAVEAIQAARGTVMLTITKTDLVRGPTAADYAILQSRRGDVEVLRHAEPNKS